MSLVIERGCGMELSLDEFRYRSNAPDVALQEMPTTNTETHPFRRGTLSSSVNFTIPYRTPLW